MRQFSEIPLQSFGATRRLIGVVYADADEQLVVYFPGEGRDSRTEEMTSPSSAEWQALLQQSDRVETLVTVKDADGKLTQAILRKAERQISQNISWQVYRRDHYRCRYCGTGTEPLTVDHLVLWEEGGPSTPENLVASCKKCNTTRGSMAYATWLRSAYYRKVSAALPPAIQEANEHLVASLPSIPRNYRQSR